MQLYLVRHATPAAESGDPDLSDGGRAEADQLAALFGRLQLPAWSVAVLASPARRARQTAAPIAAALGVPDGDIRTFPAGGAPPPAAPAGLLAALVGSLSPPPVPDHVVLVGHWGTVNAVYGWLVGVPPDHFPADKATAAAVACQLPFAERSGRLLWLLRPALLPGPASPAAPEGTGGATGAITRVGGVEVVGALRGPEDVSAVDASGDYLLVGSDETNRLQVLRGGGDRFEVTPHDVVLDPAAGEVDIEGVTHDGDTVYVLGSHSWKRKKVDPDKTHEKNRQALEKVSREPDRELLCRFRLGADGVASAVERTTLRPALDAHPVLKAFAGVPGKENGIDLEGLAFHDGRLYVGFRGPVLRGNLTPVLRCRFATPVTETELLYVTLGGRGVRDLVRVRDGFLVLAGPAGEGPGSYQLYRWDGGDCLPGTRAAGRAGRCDLVGEISPDGGLRAEALTVVGESASAYDVLVVYDGVTNGGPARFRVARA